MRIAKVALLGFLVMTGLVGTVMLISSASSSGAEPERRDYWHHHDGRWSYWHTGDKRWYYTDGSHWYYQDGDAWKIYAFDRRFGGDGFVKGEYDVPRNDNWHHHDGHWSYWHGGDKRWYYTDGKHWFYQDNGTWKTYRFDRAFGRDGFVRGDYRLPSDVDSGMVPRHNPTVAPTDDNWHYHDGRWSKWDGRDKRWYYTNGNDWYYQDNGTWKTYGFDKQFGRDGFVRGDYSVPTNDNWHQHDGRWSYWDGADKRWYNTDGNHWYYQDNGAWKTYGFDKQFGRKGFVKGDYKVPAKEVDKVVAPRVVVPRHDPSIKSTYKAPKKTDKVVVPKHRTSHPH